MAKIKANVTEEEKNVRLEKSQATTRKSKAKKKFEREQSTSNVGQDQNQNLVGRYDRVLIKIKNLGEQIVTILLARLIQISK